MLKSFNSASSIETEKGLPPFSNKTEKIKKDEMDMKKYFKIKK